MIKKHWLYDVSCKDLLVDGEFTFLLIGLGIATVFVILTMMVLGR